MSITAKLIAARVAPVIRTSTEDAARRAVALLSEEGFDLFEITLTTPGAMGVITDLAKDAALTIGVGTVLTAGQGEAAIEAGASFVVSPAFIPGLAEAGEVAGTPVALGAATPTEALRAHEAGAAFVKVFPAAQLGGPGFVKALKSVYPMIEIMPTGGIEAANLSDYYAAGAACVGMGGKLVSDAALIAKDDDAIRTAARTVKTALAKIA